MLIHDVNRFYSFFIYIHRQFKIFNYIFLPEIFRFVNYFVTFKKFYSPPCCFLEIFFISGLTFANIYIIF